MFFAPLKNLFNTISDNTFVLTTNLSSVRVSHSEPRQSKVGVEHDRVKVGAEPRQVRQCGGQNMTGLRWGQNRDR
ncbi:hypothetical protein DPEC_G00230880 [Dallia pectoralis]|uniref:Uncharacterized protein n=1 Tax=Dallia pectoralis TaxID=75939 RepID=A0ACC2FWQ0_DALPE|nr:hypothetical protein DPEC_G00230880 [Dallia pectoralis]